MEPVSLGSVSGREKSDKESLEEERRLNEGAPLSSLLLVVELPSSPPSPSCPIVGNSTSPPVGLRTSPASLLSSVEPLSVEAVLITLGGVTSVS